MENVLPVLRSCALTACLSQETLEKIVIPAGRARQYPKNTAVFQIRDRVTELGVLVSGKVNLCYYTQNGVCNLQGSLQTSGLIGLDLICTGTKIAPYMAIAAEDSRIFSVPAELFLLPGRIPEAERMTCIDRLLRLLSDLNMKKEYRIAILTQAGLRDRILTYLTMQANRRQTATFAIPFNRDEMASFLGVNRSALSHELGKMRKEGLIDFKHNVFHLLAPDVPVPDGAGEEP